MIYFGAGYVIGPLLEFHLSFKLKRNHHQMKSVLETIDVSINRSVYFENRFNCIETNFISIGIFNSEAAA